MTDTMTSQNIVLFSWDTLYVCVCVCVCVCVWLYLWLHLFRLLTSHNISQFIFVQSTIRLYKNLDDIGRKLLSSFPHNGVKKNLLPSYHILDQQLNILRCWFQLTDILIRVALAWKLRMYSASTAPSALSPPL
jgi:hypothetical protein